MIKKIFGVAAALILSACAKDATERSLEYHKLRRMAGITDDRMQIVGTDVCEVTPLRPNFDDLNQFYNLAHASFCNEPGCGVEELERMLDEAGISYKLSYVNKSQDSEFSDFYVHIMLMDEADIERVADIIDDPDNGFFYYRHIARDRFEAASDRAYFAQWRKDREKGVAECKANARSRAESVAKAEAERIGAKLGYIVDISMNEENMRDPAKYIIGRRIVTVITYTIGKI